MVILFIFSEVLFLAFAAVQVVRPETATVPARVITHRSVLLTAIYTFLVASCMMLMTYSISIWCMVLARI